jgi:hypothetical protein
VIHRELHRNAITSLGDKPDTFALDEVNPLTALTHKKHKRGRTLCQSPIWDREAVWQSLLHSLYPLARRKAGRREAPSVAIMDGQSIKTTEKGAFAALTLISASRAENGTF